MSILSVKKTVDNLIADYQKSNRNKEGAFEYQKSMYRPDAETRQVLMDVIKNFSDGYTTLARPRTEFNDLSWVDRMGVDQLMWNTYQPNDGDVPDGDPANSWRSRAIRPITRNKVVSIAAKMLVKSLFPKVFSYSQTDEEEQEAAIAMSDMMEWVGDQIDYPSLSLFAVVQALVNPVAIVYTGFEESFRVVKRPKVDDDGDVVRDEDGFIVYDEKVEIDEEMSGFKASCVPNDEFYISDFYQRDVQLQDWVIWRKVCNYELARQKYGSKYKNFVYVKPGVQTIYIDANLSFYEVYDSNMQKNEVEEVYYWNRRKDQFLIVVNGVMMTKHDNPNPRNDKLYPFVSFFYEPFDEGRCFCGKSLVFKLAPDYRVINSLYPMIIDGTFLNIFPPTYSTGSEVIGSDVIIPGMTTTLSDPNAKLETLMVAQNLNAGMSTMFQVENSINQSSEVPTINMPGMGKERVTKAQQRMTEAANAENALLFQTMISTFVKKFGRLMIGDILQFMTLPEVKDIEGDNLAYRSILIPEKMSGNEMKTRKITFDGSIPDDPISSKEYLDRSYDMIDEEGGLDSDLEIWKINPTLYRKLKFILKITPQSMNPMSAEEEKDLLLEMFDKTNGNPIFDPIACAKDFLLGAYDKSKRNPSKYLAKQQPGGGQSSPTGQGAVKSAVLGGTPPAMPTADIQH